MAKKKDTRSLDARALEVMQRVNNKLNSEKGELERNRDGRFMKVILTLLEFKTVKNAEKWLLKRNPMCGDLSPIDLVNSEYATRHLLAWIERDQDKGKK